MARAATQALTEFLHRRMQQGNISSTTLLLTFFCDVVTEHGGEIWLGSVINALAPLGISERLIRTSVFRLIQDDWLESRKQGRRSYYRLTETGEHYYQRAAKRIYASHSPAWDGVWTLLFASMVDKDKRDSLRKGLLWLGYGSFAPGVFALPSGDVQSLNELLRDLDLEESIVKMRAQAEASMHGQNLKKLVLSRWDLDDLRRRFAEFTKHYEAAAKILRRKQQPDAQTLLLLRVLMIHEYRRLLLQDPELPATMMPANWEGHAAQKLVGNIYRMVADPTSRWISRELVGANGPLEECQDLLQKRFPN
ncbi:MAG: phenylacetic acid degradation operon negative regulatory protein PaaX [Lysobacterales bacterium]|jgi:phenylacetic acid degradation operon negative regulatory protein